MAAAARIRWGPDLPSPSGPGPVRDAARKACERALADAYKNFVFDKMCYKVAPEGLGSRGLAETHACGNCYSFALYAQLRLLRGEGLRSHVIAGNVPKYFMRPDYKGICHAALYVPSAACVLDPSVYAPPLPLRGRCVPEDGTIMRVFADEVRTSLLPRGKNSSSSSSRGGGYPVFNPRTGGGAVEVPAGTPMVKVQLFRRGQPTSEYEYVLRGIVNFDASVTRAVHGINKSLFRTATDRKGRFLFKLELNPDDSVEVTDYRDNKVFKRPLAPGGRWSPAAGPPRDPDMRRFLRALRHVRDPTPLPIHLYQPISLQQQLSHKATDLERPL